MATWLSEYKKLKDDMGKWRIGEPVLLYTECKQPIEKNA